MHAFRIHRVNDYDLAIQHNEAEALDCEHTGVPHTKTDACFDGSYTLPASPRSTTVAVKIVDMPGEEVVVVAEV